MARIACLVLALCVAFAAADILVDDYQIVSPKLVLDTGAKTNSVTGPSTQIVGGERDVSIQGQFSGCTLSFPETFVSAGFFLSNPSTLASDCQGSATAQYDGVDGANTNALGLNLDLSTMTGLTVQLANDNNPGNRYTFSFFSDASSVCTRTIDHTGRGSNNPDTITIPVGDFSNGCNLASIRAIEVTMEGGTDVDQNIQLVRINQPQLGAIIVTVFDDCDCDGIFDSNEAARNGISISVVGTGSCSSVNLNQNTGSSGTVSFGSLNACTYTVTMNGQQMCPGASNSQSVTVVAGQTASASFGIFCPPQTGDITGIVYSDCDCDGVQESGDNGVSGVTVTLSSTGTGCSAGQTETTDGTGQFNFGALNVCTYTITVSSAQCGSQPTSKSVNVVAGTAARVEFSTPAATCTVTAPADVTVACGDSTADTGSATVTGGCAVQISDSDSTQTCDPNVCGFTSTFTRTYSVTSQCGGTVSSTQRVTVGACPQGQCPPCSVTVPTVSIPTVSPVSVSPNPSPSPRSPSPRSPSPSPSPSRSCRQVCDDGDSSAASSVVASFVLAFAALIAAMVL